MTLIRDGAHYRLNSLLFRPGNGKYDFDSSPHHKVVYLPLTGISSSFPSSTGASTGSWWCPCCWTSNRPAGGTHVDLFVIHFHGTSSDVVKSGNTYRDAQKKFWSQPGPPVNNSQPVIESLIVEFPGYATASPMLPNGDTFISSRETLMQVGEKVIDFVVNKMGIPESVIMLSGRSMGSGIALELALGSRHLGKLRGLILLSPYASLLDVVAGVAASKTSRCLVPVVKSILQHVLMPLGKVSLCEPAALLRQLLKDERARREISEQQPFDIFISHGEHDTLIPISHARELHGLLTELFPPSMTGAGHSPISMHVDPTGGHSDLVYQAELAKFCLGVAAKQQQQQKQRFSSSATPIVDLTDGTVFASPSQVSKLKDNFFEEKLSAQMTILEADRAFLTIVAVSALTLLASVVGIGYLGWQKWSVPVAAQ